MKSDLDHVILFEYNDVLADKYDWLVWFFLIPFIPLVDLFEESGTKMPDQKFGDFAALALKVWGAGWATVGYGWGWESAGM